jgi:hypothetical protein
MTNKSKLEARLNALADYLGVEFTEYGNECMCCKSEHKASLSEDDIDKIIGELMQSKEFKKEYERRWNWLQDIMKLHIAKSLGWAAEDQAKFYAISEIMKANYREKLNKVEKE